MRVHLKIKHTLLTVIVALLMAFVLSCQVIAPNILKVANKNEDEESSNNPSMSETLENEDETDNKLSAGPVSFYSAEDLSKTPGVNVVAGEFIKGYNVNDINITFEEGSLDNGNILYDSLAVNDRIFGEKFYTGGTLSDLYFNQYTAQYFYTEDGKISKIIGGGTTLEYTYNKMGRLEKIFKNKELCKKYIYSDDPESDKNELWLVWIVYPALADSLYIAELKYPYVNEVAGGKIYKYSENGVLEACYNLKHELINNRFWPGDSAEQFYKAPQIDNTIYTFGHNYLDESYMTQRIVKKDGYDCNYSYEYINDKIVSETCFNRIDSKSYTLTYIFDSAFNRTGFYYNYELFYYVLDIFGNVEKIIDFNGNEVVKYSYDLFGNCTVSGTHKDSIGLYNSYTYRALDDWYYDNILNFYYVGSNKIFDVKSGSFIQGNLDKFSSVNFTKFILDPLSKTVKNDKIESFKPFIKMSLLDETLIKEKIAYMAGQNLLAENIKPYSNILVWEFSFATFDAESGIFSSDKANEKFSLGRADIYTASDRTARGDIFGSQIYILGKSGDLTYAENKLYNLTNNNSYVYDGQERFYAYAGEIAFEGHFIYLKKYVTYKSAANGIIEFNIKADKSDLYKRDIGNLYNFDTERYVLFYGSDMEFEGIERVSNIQYVPDMQKIHDDMYNSLCNTEGLGCYVDATYTTYYSESYALELQKNTNGKITYFGGYDLNELKAEMGDKFMFTSKNGQTVVVEQKDKDEFDIGDFLTKMAVGFGIIVITSSVIALTGGSATPFVCFLVTGATLTSISLAGGALAAGIKMASGGSFANVWNGFADGFMITAAVSSLITAATGTGACFAAGTEVKTANGTKAIEHIKAGDLVLSYNEKTKKTEYQTVQETFIRRTLEKINIKTEKDDIITTPEHPFYSNGRWIKAKDLRAGDRLQDVNGKTVTVEQIKHELLETPLTVYNFKVNKNHNYYIGSGILVHNAGYSSAAALKLPSGISIGGGLSLGKVLLFAEITTLTLVVGGSASIPQYTAPTTAEASIRRAAAAPRVRPWQLLDYTANGGEMNMNTNFIPAVEINFKLEMEIMNNMTYLQALAYLHLLGLINSAGKYTEAYMPYLNDPWVKKDVAEARAMANGKKNVHFGVYTECPSHAMELGVAAGCGPITYGYVKAPEKAVFYGDGYGTISAYLVATDNFPGYYHLRGPNDAFRVWCMYPLFIRENEVVWIDPRRDANGNLPPEDTYIYDPKFIFSDDYMEYQQWLYREFADDIFEWEWWSVIM